MIPSIVRAERDLLALSPARAVLNIWAVFILFQKFVIAGLAVVGYGGVAFYFSVTQADNAPGVFGCVCFVRDKDDSVLAGLIQLLKYFHNHLSGLGIKIAGWFIREDYAGI
jgi:hypothetical protein